jgi:hypothetical protein
MQVARDRSEQVERLAELVRSGTPVMFNTDECIGAVNNKERFRALIWLILPRVPSAQDVVRCELQLQGVPDFPACDESPRSGYSPVLILVTRFSSVVDVFKRFPFDPMQFFSVPDGFDWKDIR